MDEGWGEPCYGSITVTSESPITIVDEVITKEMVKKELEEQLAEDYMIEYKKQGKYPEWFERLERYLQALGKLKL